MSRCAVGRERHSELRRYDAVERRSERLGAVQRSCVNERSAPPVTCDSVMTCIDAGAVERSSARLNAVQRRWERPAAPSLLPPRVADLFEPDAEIYRSNGLSQGSPSLHGFPVRRPAPHRCGRLYEIDSQPIKFSDID